MAKRKAERRKEDTEKKEEIEIKECFFAFEVVKQYPYSRSYIIKAPLKKSFKDTVSELFSGRF